MIPNIGKTDEMYLSLFEMVTDNGMKNQCAKISEWIKQHYNVDQTGFLIQDDGSSPSYFSTETTAIDIAKNIEEIFQKAPISEAATQSQPIVIY